MKISTSYPYYNYTPKYQTKNNPSFGHHPDFVRIARTRPICMSSFFRRDYVAPGSEGFYDIVNLFRKVFTGNDGPKKMLIAGIANSEEPFSYLPTIKQLNPDKPIEDVVDLYIIDLQSKPDDNTLFDESYTMEYIPIYAKDSFIYSPHPKIACYDYRVNDELLEFLSKTYNNPSKSKWESRLQEANYPENYFDIISVNNVLYYIPEPQIIPTYDNLFKAVKPGGYIIAEEDRYAENCQNKFNLTPYRSGIHRKNITAV